MDRIMKLKLAILPIISTLHFAEAGEVTIPHLYALEQHQWRPVSTQMSHQEYQPIVRQNQRMTRKYATKYLQGKVLFLGVPNLGIDITSAAIGIAVDGAKLHLNKSHTLALEVDNVLKNDPELFLKVKFDW